MVELKNSDIKDEIDKYVVHMFKHHDEPNVRDGKVIHDAIWGTRRFKDYEVALLDTPIIQRLRQIHQTGLAYLTFPSATHTRFEHTLGVTIQVSKLLEALREKEGKSDIDENLINTLRIAAMFHDTGHTPFSHASEEIVESYPEIVEFKKDNHDKFGTAKAHEIFSYYILQSDILRDFINDCVKDKTKIDIDLASNSIIGYSPDENYYKIQALNGPFDADKLDYVHRDGEASGLPLRIDLDRLWYSINISDISAIIGGKKTKRLTIDSRGSTSLEQILFTKMILFTTIYQHHKVRASECMLRGIIEYAKNKNIPICGHNLDSPVDFLYITDADIFGNNSLLKDNNLHNLIHNLEYRRLLKRAIIISNNTITEDSESGYNKLLNQLKDYKFLRELANEIWDENPLCLKEEVWIDLPKRPNFKEADTAFITPLSNEKPLNLSELFPVGQWSKQYSFNRWRGHVFAPEKCKKEIAESSKKILKKEFGIEFKQEAMILCYNS
jgi:HD superfamily phosphohydrolase